MKIALVHDWLVNFAGAERALEAIYELFPGDIFTLVKDEDALKGSLFERANIFTSFIQSFPKAKKKYRNYLPFFPFAIEQFDLSGYDVVISSSHAVAKGVLTSSNQVHICYCYTPIRYAWDLYYQYLKEANLEKGIKGLLAKIVLHYIRIWDQTTANRVDYFIAISNYIARRIKKIYGKDSKVIYPPVDTQRFELFTKKEEFYLAVSRMVPYKKIDIIVEAFKSMPDKKLLVIGDGPDFEKIKKIASGSKNIELLGYQKNSVVKEYMQKAKAFIFAADEDFGIVLVEAQSCGTPVIAYAKGGSLETVLENKTGVFFYEQTEASLIDALKRFDKMEFDPYLIRQNVLRFSKERFKKEFKDFVESVIKA